MTTQQILQLLEKLEKLLKEVGDLNARIIRLTMETGADLVALPGARAGGAKRGAAGGGRRKWFERGEMIKLSRKLLTAPMTQADLVRALGDAKGYEKSLPESEKARFRSAAYQAIAAALAAKQLFRTKQGQVSTRR